ncbi:ABC transporter substrate-binding protein [Pseudanabaena mucicola]|uniref:ABC transporter substrate-binding protein n=1 Tax=Pseudanabaena mucicola FACHB-723 TaxID=2692860 RepID=A0ABR7ZTE6_9CYAN|nr:ABC transporter substrate-binding protein [Pseudanabaena mucicola]MBD2187022.1 ABC transporter substrate-binding protein [Pseudanabaena mucicola FACHB-723]
MKSKFIKGLLLSLCVVVTAIAIKACSNPAQNLQTFKVGINSWPGYQIALYAKEAGLFSKRGLDVEFIRFNNQQDNIRATMRGSQDASFTPLSEVMQVDANQENPVIIMVCDISAGSDGIAAAPDIKSVKDLKGKKVSAKLSTVSHLVLLEALKANQLKPKDVEIVDVANERGAAMLKDGKISASVLWEPLMSNAAKAAKGKVIHTTADVDSVVIDSLATRSSVLTNQEDILVKFIEAWFETIQAVETKPKEVFASVAKQLNMPIEVFEEDYKGLKKGDLAMNQRMFAGGRLLEASKQTRELLITDPRHGRKVRDNVDIVNASPITKATKNWQS